MSLLKRKEPPKSKWNGDNIRELFNIYSSGVKAIYDRFGADIQGCGLYVDQKTDDPYITFIFRKGSKPDLSALPSEIPSNDGASKLTVKHEFRGPAYLA